MDLPGSHYVSRATYVEHPLVRMTSPTCEDLGIPTEEEEVGGVYPLFPPRIIHNPSLHLDGLRYEAETQSVSDPYSPLCMIPLPGALAIHAASEPSFIRKRNERERERVRCVNEGYERLKEHLPNAAKEKRISKVETLRGAIDYIHHLQTLLDQSALADDRRPDHVQDLRRSFLGPHVKSTAESPAKNEVERPRLKRRGSLSSEQSPISDATLSETEEEQFVKRRRVQ